MYHSCKSTHNKKHYAKHQDKIRQKSIVCYPNKHFFNKASHYESGHMTCLYHPEEEYRVQDVI